MPDICMCQGTGCPMKETCYRYTAEPNPYRQSYFAVVPVADLATYGDVPSKKVCDYYVPNTNESK